MTQRYLVAACVLSGVMESAPAELCAQAAGVQLFADIKNYLPDVRGDKAVFNSRLAAHLSHAAVVPLHAAEAWVKGNGDHIVIDADEPPQLDKPFKQHKAVLAARNAYGDPVAVLYHVKLLNSLSHISKHFLHYPHLFLCDIIA